MSNLQVWSFLNSVTNLNQSKHVCQSKCLYLLLVHIWLRNSVILRNRTLSVIRWSCRRKVLSSWRSVTCRMVLETGNWLIVVVKFVRKNPVLISHFLGKGTIQWKSKFSCKYLKGRTYIGILWYILIFPIILFNRRA